MTIEDVLAQHKDLINALNFIENTIAELLESGELTEDQEQQAIDALCRVL